MYYTHTHIYIYIYIHTHTHTQVSRFYSINTSSCWWQHCLHVWLWGHPNARRQWVVYLGHYFLQHMYHRYLGRIKWILSPSQIACSRKVPPSLCHRGHSEGRRVETFFHWNWWRNIWFRFIGRPSPGVHPVILSSSWSPCIYHFWFRFAQMHWGYQICQRIVLT